jgi:hypothetical protein
MSSNALSIVFSEMRSLIVRRPKLESLGVLVRFDEIQKFQGFGFCFQLFGPRELDFERSTEVHYQFPDFVQMRQHDETAGAN